MFNETKITISGLSPVTTYKFHVWAENGVSNLTSSENRQFVDVAVTTSEASVKSASVNNVRVMLVKPSEIALSWDPPMAGFGPDSGDSDPVEVYEVSVRHESAHSCRRATRASGTRDECPTIPDLTYPCVVCPRNNPPARLTFAKTSIVPGCSSLSVLSRRVFLRS